MQLFYIPDNFEDTIILPVDEAKHCIKVLRLGKGDEVQLVDGKGTIYRAIIEDDNWNNCTLRISEKISDFGKRNYHLHIAVAPTKNTDRYEWFVEKAVEIGVDIITPLICEHSERKSIPTERLERIAISAMKQSVKAFKTEIRPAVSFNQFVNSANEDLKLIAHCDEGNKTHIQKVAANKSSITILIGPEGDFSTKEINWAISKNFTPVSLGESRLRTETAAVAACYAINLLNTKQ